MTILNHLDILKIFFGMSYEERLKAMSVGSNQEVVYMDPKCMLSGNSNILFDLSKGRQGKYIGYYKPNGSPAVTPKFDNLMEFGGKRFIPYVSFFVTLCSGKGGVYNYVNYSETKVGEMLLLEETHTMCKSKTHVSRGVEYMFAPVPEKVFDPKLGKERPTYWRKYGTADFKKMFLTVEGYNAFTKVGINQALVPREGVHIDATNMATFISKYGTIKLSSTEAVRNFDFSACFHEPTKTTRLKDQWECIQAVMRLWDMKKFYYMPPPNATETLLQHVPEGYTRVENLVGDAVQIIDGAGEVTHQRVISLAICYSANAYFYGSAVACYGLNNGKNKLMPADGWKSAYIDFLQTAFYKLESYKQDVVLKPASWYCGSVTSSSISTYTDDGEDSENLGGVENVAIATYVQKIDFGEMCKEIADKGVTDSYYDYKGKIYVVSGDHEALSEQVRGLDDWTITVGDVTLDHERVVFVSNLWNVEKIVEPVIVDKGAL
jgi:hypothetical protein